MNDLAGELERLREDYDSCNGAPFKNFYCPMLFADEPTDLCRGHIVNEALKSSSAWVVQRKDIDNFFGTYFEADFINVPYCRESIADEAIFDDKLRARLMPTITRNGEVVGYYLPKGDVPPAHTLMLLEKGGRSIKIALKIAPEVVADSTSRWQISVEKDLRIAAFVSLIKAAYLTMFKVFGYSYVLSAGGHLVGKTILGELFLKHRILPKADLVSVAVKEMTPYVNMVRPVVDYSPGMLGSIEGGDLVICGELENAWGLMIYVRAASTMHAVIMPVIGNPNAVSRFDRFLKRGGAFEARQARYSNGTFDCAKSSRLINWPVVSLV